MSLVWINHNRLFMIVLQHVACPATTDFCCAASTAPEALIFFFFRTISAQTFSTRHTTRDGWSQPTMSLSLLWADDSCRHRTRLAKTCDAGSRLEAAFLCRVWLNNGHHDLKDIKEADSTLIKRSRKKTNETKLRF